MRSSIHSPERLNILYPRNATWVNAARPPINSGLILIIRAWFFLYDGCIQRISLPDGKVLSQTLAKENEKNQPQAWFATQYLTTQDSVFYSDNHPEQALYRIDFANWNGKLLYQDKKFGLLPKTVIGNVLIVDAAPEYDDNQHEFWGIDIQSGDVYGNMH